MAANTLNITSALHKAKVSCHGDMDIAFNQALSNNFTITLFTSSPELFVLSSTLYQFKDFAGNLVNVLPFGGKPGLWIELTLDLAAGIFYPTRNNLVVHDPGMALIRNKDLIVTSAVPVPNGAEADIFNFSLRNGANLTVPPMINPVQGKTYLFYFQQDATGGRRLNFNSQYKFPFGRAPVLTTNMLAIDLIKVTPRGENILLCEVVNGYSTTPVAQIGALQYDLMSAAVAAAVDGDIITVLRTANLQEATAGVNTDNRALAIIGAPGKMPDLRTDGTITLAFGKATISFERGELYMRDLKMSGASIPATGNGAAIRVNPLSRYLQLDNVNFYGNENGILTSALDPTFATEKDVYSIVVQDSILNNNGYSVAHRGLTHNVYLGERQRFYAVRSQFTNSEFGHDFKTRAQQNLVDRCIFEGAKEGRAFDMPNGTILHAVNCYFRKLPSASQSNLIGIGQEGYAENGQREQQYIFRNCLFENRKSTSYHLSFINQEETIVTPVYFIDCVFLADDEGVYNVCEGIHIHTGGPLGPEGYTGPVGFIPPRFTYNQAVEGMYSLHADQPVLIHGPDPTLSWFPAINSPATNPNAPLPATVLVRTSSLKNYPGTNAGAGGTQPPPPPPDDINPTVTLASSDNNVDVEQTITLTATASDNVAVTQVVFSRNGVAFHTDTTAPYTATVTLNNLDNGTISFTATAFDAQGNVATSSNVDVVVNIPEPVVIDPNILIDDTTKAEYDAAIAAAAVGDKRVAAANAIINAMKPDYRLYIYQNNTLVIPAEYTGDIQLVQDTNDVSIRLGTPDSAEPLVAANLGAGTWRFELQGGANYARVISGSVGVVGSGAHLELDNNPAPGDGFDQQITFTIPRSVDGL